MLPSTKKYAFLALPTAMAILNPTVIFANDTQSASLLTAIREDYKPLYRGDHLQNYKKEIKAYSSNPHDMEHLISNSRPYLYYIFQEVKKNNLPAQLVFVPAAETNYVAKSVSHVGAAGLWQFMPSTAKDYNMHIRQGYDGRGDVIKSTDAGLKHLKTSYNRFHSWPLAFAAYNCGDGRVDSAIRYNKARGLPTDFWHLTLPRETQTYVRNILAISAVFSKPEPYGIHFEDIPNKPYFSKIKIKQYITPNSAGYISGVNSTDMKKLNPAIKNWGTTLATDYTLLVPRKDKPQVIARLAAVDAVAA